MTVVYTAPSIIERDALLNELAEAGIKAFGENRDVSRKIANSTVDLAYEGYSAVMGGFSITVEDDQADSAKKIIENFLRKIKISGDLPSRRSDFQKFYMSSIFSLSIPIIFHLTGIYYLRQGLKRGEKIRPFYFYGSLVLFLLSGILGYNLIQGLFKSLSK